MNDGGSLPLSRRFGGLVFNGPPPRADRVSANWLREGEQTGIEFSIDSRFTSKYLVDWESIGGGPAHEDVDALNWALLALAAQYCLPSELVVADQRAPAQTTAYGRLLQMLYDIRAFCDETAYRDRPVVRARSGNAAGSREASLDPNRVLLVLSGGFDSTFAAICLKQAGCDVQALHVRVNRHVEVSEEGAAEHVAKALDLPLHKITLEFRDQEAIGRYYSRTFGEYPFYNSIPHGRDFPLAVLAGIVAKRLGCAAVAFGHEKESRTKVIRDRGRDIHRHDVESAHGRALARTYLRSTVCPDLELFSPIAGVSLYQVRRAMLAKFPGLVPHLRSCFWSAQCEKCLKCLSTYTMQRHLGANVIDFEGNLFADLDDEDMALLARPDRPSEALGYGPMMHYAMTRIIEDGQATPDDYWLRVYKTHGLESVRKRWDVIKGICLGQGEAHEAPRDVQSALAGIIES